MAIPDSWEWCRWGELSQSIQYGYNAPAKQAGRIKMVRISDIQDNKVLWDSVPYCDIDESDIDTYLLQANDILFARTGGTVGKSYLVKDVPEDAIYAGYLIRTRYSNSLCSEYLKFFMESELYWTQLRNGTIATAQPNCNGKTLSNMIVPVPPLSEQHRIVAKIEELLPFIERYGKAEEHLTALNTTFPEALKKSILQEAVQGKLVPQNPDDEPASVLLERIRAEKQALIKAGKIKKDKHESVIVTRDKIPYEIPDSWEWCKLSDLAILENGDRSSKYPVEADYVESGIPFFGAKDIDGEMMSFQNVRFISQQKYDELGNGKLVDGDIICLLRGSVGKTAKFEANEQFDTGFICAQMLIIRLLDKSLFGYISSYFKSPDYTNYVESKVTGTAVRQMPAKEMGNLLIPLPPLNEQHRIVSKIEEIMPYINTITK
ncbi:MAG: restriction endonuclease subunit S [Oscillospiraceae bacterium]|nr:restriction endonuclease subunit S [Oscillospiraceae bacterium]